MNYSSRPAWRSQWLSIMVAVLLFVLSGFLLIRSTMTGENGNIVFVGICLVIWMILVLVILYRRYRWHYFVNDEAIESHHGIVGRDIKSIRIKDLRNVNLRQSFFQRILGIGNLEFSSAGGGDVEVFFFQVYNPMELKRKIEERQRSG